MSMEFTRGESMGFFDKHKKTPQIVLARAFGARDVVAFFAGEGREN